MAKHFRKTESTITNWRRKGYFTYFRLPDSKSVLYLLESVEDFEREYTVISKRKEVYNKSKLKAQRKPIVPTTPKKDQWEVQL